MYSLDLDSQILNIYMSRAHKYRISFDLLLKSIHRTILINRIIKEFNGINLTLSDLCFDHIRNSYPMLP